MNPIDPSSKPRARVLVVDDERIVAQDVSESLENMGCSVVDTALSGPDAIERAREHRPDLIMMDVVLQGDMDGIQAASIIRKEMDISCIFLTAYSDPAMLDRAKLTNPAGYIVKPFEEAGLRSTVEIALYKVEAERALRESQEWLSTTLLSMEDSVVTLGPDEKIHFLNPSAEKLSGMTLAEARGRNISEVFKLFDGVSGQPVEDIGSKAVREGLVASGGNALLLPREKGDSVFLDCTASTIVGQQGMVNGAVIVLRDVTSQKVAERELHEYRDRLEVLVEKRTHEIKQRNEQLGEEVEVRRKAEKALEYRVEMQNLVTRVSFEFLRHKQTEMNEAMTDALKHIADFFKVESAFLFEYSPDGKTLSLSYLWHAEEKFRRMRRAFRNLKSSRFPWFRLQLHQSEVLFVENPEKLPPEALPEREFLMHYGLKTVLGIPVREGEKVTGCLGRHVTEAARPWVKEDITCLQMCSDVIISAINRLQAEEEKGRLQEQLGQSQKMEAVGKLSGGIAHDFNNMLLPIIGYTDMLLTTMEVDDPRVNDLEEIRKAAERAASLTRQLLAFSRKQVIAKTIFDLNDAIDSMENMLVRLIGEDVMFECELDPAVRRVRADRGQIEQVLLNLVVNARDAMPTGGSITVRTGNIAAKDDKLELISDEMPRGSYVFIEVSDTGCGMTEELVHNIFDPFYTTKGLDGTGLGLSVVYGILEQHNGGVIVDSLQGEGSVFTVFLPAAADAEAKAPDQQNSMSLTESVRSPESAREWKGEGERILLVEDEAGVSKFVSEALSQNGYEVLSAANLREARKVFEDEEGRFDMVFSDAVLPDGNGLELLDDVLDSHPQIRALLSSGYTDKHAVIEMLKQRPISFLQKPYSLPKLISTVGTLIHEEDPEPLVLTAED